MLINADLHIHGRYSMGVSKDMKIKVLARESGVKGMDLLASGDCLHPDWLEEVLELEEVEEGTYEHEGTRFVLSAEVEDQFRVHHLLLFPSAGSVGDFRERVSSRSKNLDSDGRPNLRMGGEDIAQAARDCGALMGPCHAFTPWTAIYAAHDSLEACYGDMEPYVSFVELGLSADTDYADRIGELSRLTFLTNSDAHSPHPVRLAREFNRFRVDEPTFEGLKKAILREGPGLGPVLNVGLPPWEGKYNESACVKCFTHYSLTEARMKRWKCTCGRRIKRGVRDRVEELADSDEPAHPGHRPPYLHIIPLAEIIAMAIGHGSPRTKGVTDRWRPLIERFGSEVGALVDAELADIEQVAEDRVVRAIRLFREGRIVVHPGGGGQYGRIELPGDDTAHPPADPRGTPSVGSQVTLFEYDG